MAGLSQLPTIPLVTLQDKTAARVIGQLQQNLVVWTSQVSNDPLVGGSIVSFQAPVSASADFAVYHQLGRKPNGWQLVNKLGAGDIWQSPTVNKLPNSTFIFQASTGSLSGSLRFF